MSQHPDLFTALADLDLEQAEAVAHRAARRDEFPILPYAGASGGRSPSYEATVYADTHGITADAQRTALAAVTAGKAEGATVKEVRDAHAEFHHGRISGALSHLHKEGHLALLVEKRLRCHVYVLPDWVQDRPTIEHTANRAPAVPHCPACGHNLEEPYSGPAAVTPPF